MQSAVIIDMRSSVDTNIEVLNNRGVWRCHHLSQVAQDGYTEHYHDSKPILEKSTTEIVASCAEMSFSTSFFTMNISYASLFVAEEACTRS